MPVKQIAQAQKPLFEEREKVKQFNYQKQCSLLYYQLCSCNKGITCNLYEINAAG